MISVSEILEGFSGDGWREEGGREGGRSGRDSPPSGMLRRVDGA